ncbi:MAG: purine-binding chemotaxis protein CheW [Verrucomicrobiaceae bacterium]|nr:MAG: purine-binding chemotaxis protein CheW [Verrucomicrobiaceae bacterium]
MLLITFQLGEDWYALDTAQVAEVLPMVLLKGIPGSAQGVTGIFNYHGRPVPVIDLAEMALGTPTEARMSTRIILVRYPDEGESRLLGLLAERATDVLRCSEADFSDPGLSADETPYLGPVTRVNEKIIQLVKVDSLLSDNVRTQLFRHSAGVA